MDPLVADIVNQLDADLREDFEERAGIMQFDGGLPKDHAECLALIDLLRRHPALLTGVAIFQTTLDGATQWFLAADRDAAQKYLVDIGATEIVECDLAQIIHQQ